MELWSEFIDEMLRVAQGLRSQAPEPDLREVARHLHTLKGAAGFVGLDELVSFLHAAEEEIKGWKETPDEFGHYLAYLADLLEEGAEQLARERREFLGELPRLLEDLKAKKFSGYWAKLGRRVWVDADALEELLALAGELAEAAEGKLKLLAENLRSKIASLRLVRLGRLRPYLESALEREAGLQGKLARLEFRGDAEVEREAAEAVAEALVHLIRNAVAHGIEAPEEREKLGKPPVGTVSVSVRAEGEQLMIAVEDDGRGIDLRAVRERARQLGLEGEPLEVIFHPSFSLKAEVDLSAGRGVGLDAVRRAVEELGGEVSVQTEQGRGTRFLLVLPTGLSNAHVLVFGDGSSRIGVLASAVSGVHEPSEVKLEGRWAKLGDEVLKVVSLFEGEPEGFVRVGRLLLAAPRLYEVARGIVRKFKEPFRGRFLGYLVSAGVPVPVLNPKWLLRNF